jgi:23S rRNA (adenine2503-C2)-methyltransferase
LHDGNEVEAVLMEHLRRSQRRSASRAKPAARSRATFCSTGQAGFTRHLSCDRNLRSSALFCASSSKPQWSKKITNVVFMGQGEPFANYDAVMDAVRLLNDPEGFGLGHRHITISTVGLVPQIDRFANEGVQVNLAISLHAPTDSQRSKMMPVNQTLAARRV